MKKLYTFKEIQQAFGIVAYDIYQYVRCRLPSSKKSILYDLEEVSEWFASFSTYERK